MKPSWPAALLLILLPGWLLSQSLGELAEQEKAKRKKTGAKAYTNDDLQHPSPSPSPSPSATPSPQAKPGPAARNRDRFKAEPTSPPSGGKPSGESASPAPSETEAGSRNESAAAAAKDEEHWRSEREAREKAVKAAEDDIKALEQRMSELGSDLNPNSADVLDPDRGRKRDAELRDKADQLERAKAALARARQHLADLDEEARRAGVPPGWVR